MSELVGIFHQNGSPVERHILDAMIAIHGVRDQDAVTRVIGSVGMGIHQFRLLPASHEETQPLSLGDLHLIADCRLDNRPELGRWLDLNREQVAEISDAMLILLSYRQWGEDCPKRLLGDFSFVLWDAGQQRLFAARDAMGARGLCYTLVDGIFLIASEIAHLLAHPAVRPCINDERVAAFLVNLWDKPEETFYRDIFYLPPAHSISVTAGGIEHHRFWEIQSQPIRYRNANEYAEHYKELLAETVRSRLRVIGPVGISLSGGLDSTSLAALAAPMLLSAIGQNRLMSFSYSFDELKSCDERDYIRPVVERYGLDATYVPSDESWSFKNISNLPSAPDYIFSDAFVWLPVSVMTVAARAGVRSLMAGYFGDVLMTGEHYWALDMAQAGRFGELGRTIWQNRGTIRWRNSFVDSGFRRLIPPEAAQIYRKMWPRQAVTVAPGIHEDLLARTELRYRLLPQALPSSMRAPGLAQRYQSMMSNVFSQVFATSRLLYNHYGMELSLPYFDRRLVEFALNVPAYILGRPGFDRGLHREAMQGLLPEEVRLRQRPTSFAPLLIKGLRDKESGTLRRLMSQPLVVERDYVRGDWLASQLDREYEPTPSWSLLLKSIFLELWLQRYWN